MKNVSKIVNIDLTQFAFENGFQLTFGKETFFFRYTKVKTGRYIYSTQFNNHPIIEHIEIFRFPYSWLRNHVWTRNSVPICKFITMYLLTLILENRTKGQKHKDSIFFFFLYTRWSWRFSTWRTSISTILHTYCDTPILTKVQKICRTRRRKRLFRSSPNYGHAREENSTMSILTPTASIKKNLEYFGFLLKKLYQSIFVV